MWAGSVGSPFMTMLECGALGAMVKKNGFSSIDSTASSKREIALPARTSVEYSPS